MALLKKGIYLLLICILFTGIASAIKPPESYGINQCELIAKDYQKEFGGSLIWIQPMDNFGNPILGEYSAHMINKVYNKDLKIMIYVDYGNNWISSADIIIKTWNDKPVKVYDLSKERPEWSMIWHY